jgi:hypothetical protein
MEQWIPTLLQVCVTIAVVGVAWGRMSSEIKSLRDQVASLEDKIGTQTENQILKCRASCPRVRSANADTGPRGVPALS